MSSLGQREPLEQLVRPAKSRRLRQMVQPTEQHQVLPPGQDLVDRGVLADEPDPPPDLSTLAAYVVPGDGRLAGIQVQ